MPSKKVDALLLELWFLVFVYLENLEVLLR